MIIRRFYIYAYFEPLSEKPFYIGKGCGQRWLIHLGWAQLYGKDTLFYRKLRKIIKYGDIPIIRKLFENLTEEEALSKEIQLIALYGRVCDRTGCLYNIAEGGTGISGGYGPLGHETSYDTRIKLSCAYDRSKHDKQIEAHIRRTAQPIKRYDLITGVTIKRYGSIAEASKDTGISACHICNQLKGRQRNQGWDYTT